MTSNTIEYRGRTYSIESTESDERINSSRYPYVIRGQRAEYLLMRRECNHESFAIINPHASMSIHSTYVMRGGYKMVSGRLVETR